MKQGKVKEDRSKRSKQSVPSLLRQLVAQGFLGDGCGSRRLRSRSPNEGVGGS